MSRSFSWEQVPLTISTIQRRYHRLHPFCRLRSKATAFAPLKFGAPSGWGRNEREGARARSGGTADANGTSADTIYERFIDSRTLHGATWATGVLQEVFGTICGRLCESCGNRLESKKGRTCASLLVCLEHRVDLAQQTVVSLRTHVFLSFSFRSRVVSELRPLKSGLCEGLYVDIVLRYRSAGGAFCFRSVRPWVLRGRIGWHAHSSCRQWIDGMLGNGKRRGLFPCGGCGEKRIARLRLNGGGGCVEFADAWSCKSDRQLAQGQRQRSGMGRRTLLDSVNVQAFPDLVGKPVEPFLQCEPV